jgi:hypothetical protein
VPWISFERDFDWRPLRHARLIIAYRAGAKELTTTACAKAAIAKGAAKKIKKPADRKAKPNAR